MTEKKGIDLIAKIDKINNNLYKKDKKEEVNGKKGQKNKKHKGKTHDQQKKGVIVRNYFRLYASIGRN